MCGICGIVNLAHRRPIDPVKVQQMSRTLIHRGPDDEGIYCTNSVGLGFRRLSIIDLAGGHQPMSNEDGSVWIVFNGEIYNFPELKKELEAQGHKFQTNSDTEVIIHGYEQWGDDVLSYLNGMFGLAIWDEVNRRLLIARDRCGIKMVYYRIEKDELMFGSEIRPLLAATSGKPEVDPVSLNLFLRYRYVPSPHTLLKGIKKLAPGTRLIIENGEYRVERWWKYRPVLFDPPPSIEEAEEELLNLYLRAVKRQLISDVPVGLLLSGGVDSGLLLGLMNRVGRAWKTFTVGFGGSFRYNEFELAAHTANVFGAENVSVILDRETFNTTFQEIIAALEEPIASPSIIPMYHLCRRARQDVKVVLIGQGPDELLGGYRRHRGLYYGRYWRAMPQFMQTSLGTILSFLSKSEAVKRAHYSLNVNSRIIRYQQVFSLLSSEDINSLFKDSLGLQHAGDEILACWEDLLPLMDRTDDLGGFQFLEIRSSLPDELLMYADKLSMSHSLEVRVPYLDHEIVEYVERLPASYKIKWNKGKRLHRRVCRRFLPEEIIRRKKIGFATPVNSWFRQSMDAKTNDTLLDPQSGIYEYLAYEKVYRLVKEHQNGRQDNHKIMFSLIAFGEWLRNLSSSHGNRNVATTGT